MAKNHEKISIMEIVGFRQLVGKLRSDNREVNMEKINISEKVKSYASAWITINEFNMGVEPNEIA